MGLHSAVRGMVASVVALGLAAHSAAAVAQPRWKLYQPKAQVGGIGGISMGAGGAAWFSVERGVLRISADGAQRYFPAHRLQTGTGGLVLGADGRIYSAICCDESGVAGVFAIAPSGVRSFYRFPGDGSSLSQPNDGAALGSDGNVWFSLVGYYGNITPAGRITTYALQVPAGMYGNSQAPGIAGGRTRSRLVPRQRS